MVNDFPKEITMSQNQQRWDPEQYARTASFVPALGAGVLELLAPKAHERILDLGCGDGVLTQRLAELGCQVLGVDSSPEQIAAARRRGLTAQCKSGEQLDFAAEFDAVFSNAALHWMQQADAVITGVWRALRPGGRFVAEFGGLGCVAKIRQALAVALARRGIVARALDPWYFPSDREYASRLERAGFSVRSIVLFDRPTPLPTAIEGWLETFAQPFIAAVSRDERPALLSEVRGLLEPELHGPNGWVADYVRLRFHADKL
jgi:trans-aconitate methyltransferase